jgi:lysophospholipase L1-like esterase
METINVRGLGRTLAAGVLATAMAWGFTAAPATAAPADTISYVALGDSFAAGQGALPYSDATCRVSKKGYPVLGDRVKSVELVANLACEGAIIQDVPTQLASLAPEVRAEIELITITVGGNNLGLSNILTQCSVDPAGIACGEALASARTQLESGALALQLIATISAVQALAPNAEIVVTGYPYLFEPVDPLTAQLGILTDLLNASILAATTTVDPTGTQVRYVDVTAAFAGHGIGSAEPWINFEPAGGFTPEDFHPNQLGYRFGYFESLSDAGVFSAA